MSQGSILGFILSNIFISDLFLFIETNIPRNYADINTMYYLNKNTNIVISRLRHDFAIISKQFYESYIVLNADKYRFVTVVFNEPCPDFSFNDNTIGNPTVEKILPIANVIGKVIYNVSFKKYMQEKVNRKLSAL